MVALLALMATTIGHSSPGAPDKDPVRLGLSRANIGFIWFNDKDPRTIYHFGFGFGFGPSYVGFPFGRSDRMLIITDSPSDREHSIFISSYNTKKKTRFEWGLEFSSKRRLERSFHGTVGKWLAAQGVGPTTTVPRAARGVLNSPTLFAFYVTDDVGGTLTTGSMDKDGVLRWSPSIDTLETHFTLGKRGLPKGQNPLPLPIDEKERDWLQGVGENP